MIKAPEPNDSPWDPYEVFQVRLGPEMFFTAEKKAHWHHSHIPRRDYEHFMKDYAKAFNAEYSKSTKRIALLSRLRSIPDIFTIVVGVVDHSLLHQTVYGRMISYDDLFRALYDVSEKNYDPLIVIRNMSKDIENDMRNSVLRMIKSGSVSKQSIISMLSNKAKILVYIAHDYIEGGKAPRLAWPTIGIRKCKQQDDPSLYKGSQGIYHPLIESGQLLDAISFRVFAEQSQEARNFFDHQIKFERARINAIKREEKNAKNFHISTMTRSQQSKLKDLYRQWAHGREFDSDIFDRIVLLERKQHSQENLQKLILNAPFAYKRYAKKTLEHMLERGSNANEISKFKSDFTDVQGRLVEAARVAKEILEKHGVPIVLNQ